LPDVSKVKSKPVRRTGDRASRLKRLRWKVQLASAILLNSLWFPAMRGLRSSSVCLPVLNCHGCPAALAYCPIGVAGDMTAIGLVPWLALAMFGLVGLLCGRLSCSWVCPFGSLQDLLAKLPLPKWNPPRWTRWTKYGVLFGMVFLAAGTVGTASYWFFCRICPMATLTARIPAWIQGVIGINLIALTALLAFLLLSATVKRGFCRLVCPMGAGLALFSRWSLLSIKIPRPRGSKCSQCQPDRQQPVPRQTEDS